MQPVHAHVTTGQHTTPFPSDQSLRQEEPPPPPGPCPLLYERLCKQSSLWPLRTLPKRFLDPSKQGSVHFPTQRKSWWQHWDLAALRPENCSRGLGGPLGLLPGRLILIKTLVVQAPGAWWGPWEHPGRVFLILRPSASFHEGRESTDLLRPSHLPLKGGELPCNKFSTSACPRQHRATGKEKENWRRREKPLMNYTSQCPGLPGLKDLGLSFPQRTLGAGPPLHHVPAASSFHFAHLLNHKPLPPPNVHWASAGAQGIWRLWRSSLNREHSLGRQNWSLRLLSVFWTKQLSHCGSFF